jgi:hypothetical protein
MGRAKGAGALLLLLLLMVVAAATATASNSRAPQRETTFLDALVQQLELVATSYGAVVILTFFALILVLLAWELLRPDTVRLRRWALSRHGSHAGWLLRCTAWVGQDHAAAHSFRAASKATPLRTYFRKHVTAEQFDAEGRRLWDAIRDLCSGRPSCVPRCRRGHPPGAAATLKEMRMLRESLRTMPAAQREAVISRLQNPERIRRWEAVVGGGGAMHAALLPAVCHPLLAALFLPLQQIPRWRYRHCRAGCARQGHRRADSAHPPWCVPGGCARASEGGGAQRPTLHRVPLPGFVNPIPTQEAQFELEENKARVGRLIRTG